MAVIPLRKGEEEWKFVVACRAKRTKAVESGMGWEGTERVVLFEPFTDKVGPHSRLNSWDRNLEISVEMRKDGDWWRKNARKYNGGDAMAIPGRNAITKEGEEMSGSWR
jgi:hypothetical protein